MFELDNDAMETFRRYSQPAEVQLPATAILGRRSPGQVPMWAVAGGLDVAATLTGYVTTEYLSSTGDVFSLVSTVLTSRNGSLAVGVVQLVPATAYRRTGL